MARRMTSPVLVGRGDVVGQLQAAFEASREGDPRHLVIGGEAGIGKTRLLAEERALVEASGGRVLLGGCVSMGGEGLPFAPYTEILRSLVAADGVAQVTAIAGRAAPELARLVPALDTGEPVPESELWAQTRLYEALLELLRRIAERSPLMIQLEDLHWADAGTLAATSHLLRAIDVEPISVVATFRSDEISRKHPLRAWLAEVLRDADVERVELEPLDVAGVASLISHISGDDVGQREVERIHRRSDGNPFFVEELLCCRGDPSETLPASLRDVLLSRIDALPDSARQLIGVAAVGGREVEHDILTAVSEDDDDIDRDLHLLVDSGLLVPVRAIDGDDAYAFRHALVQESVYEGMLPTERRRLHQRWGEFLAEHRSAHGDGAAAAVQLAHHWREARDSRALGASIAAGDAAMASYSYGTATGEYDQALVLWTTDREAGIDHVELLERSARAAYLASDYRRAVAACRAAIEELGGADPAHLTELRGLLARTLWVAGDWAISVEQYREALRDAPTEPPRVRIRALAGLGQVYMLHARLREARPLLEEAIEGARAIGARDLEGHALNSLGAVLAGLGESTAAHRALTAALDIALELGLPDDIGRAWVNLPEIENWSGDPARALASSAEGTRACDEWGVAHSYGAYVAHGAVSFAVECGEWGEARRYLELADRLAGTAEGIFIYRASYVMEFLALTGDPAFEDLWGRVSVLMADRPASDNHGLVMQAGAEHHAFAGRHAEALEAARKGLAVIADTDVGWRRTELARVAAWPQAELGRAASAARDTAAIVEAEAGMNDLLELVRRWRDEIGPPVDTLAEVLDLDVREVEALGARMRGADDHALWAELAADQGASGRPFREAMSRWRGALAAEDAGDRETATAALREAHAIALRLGARPLLESLETMARRMRVRLGGGERSGASGSERAYGLTPRELEVLAEVAAGRTNREIAETLFISESTAGVHVSNILGKLGVSTRTEAARVALDQGLAGD